MIPDNKERPKVLKNLLKNNKENQELIAQIYTEAFNPLADQSFMRYIMDPNNTAKGV